MSGSLVLLVLLAYAIGSTPFGLIVAWLVGRIDIRQHGSQNIGATNVGRVLGSKWGLVVLLLDLLKGLLPVLFLPALFAPGEVTEVWRVAAAVATVAGHLFPFWLGFRGGKGVATSLGVVLCLAPAATGVAAATFLLSFAAWRIVSLSSMLAVVSFAIAEVALLMPVPFSSTNWPLAAFSLVVPAVIVLKHRTNLQRLIQGTEARFQFGDPPPPPPAPDSGARS